MGLIFQRFITSLATILATTKSLSIVNDDSRDIASNWRPHCKTRHRPQLEVGQLEVQLVDLGLDTPWHFWSLESILMTWRRSNHRFGRYAKKLASRNETKQCVTASNTK